MIQEHAWGEVVDITEDGRAVITAALPNLFHALDRKYKQVEIILPDGRKISPQQRRMIYAHIGDIAEWVDGFRNAETIEEAKQMVKWDFVLTRMESQERRLFSLSNCDMTTAREFCNYLIDFIIKHGVPTKRPLIENTDDVGAYVYACLVHKKCACCGRPADLHHVDTVGANGGNRDKINHLGLRALPLCRGHHTDLHKMGDKDFMEKWHLEPVKIDEKIAKVFRLNTKEGRT